MKRKAIFVAMLACSMMLNAQTTEPAVVFHQIGDQLDESYLISETVTVSFHSDDLVLLSVDGKDIREYIISKENPLIADFRDAFKITANEDPNKPGDYYSTFYSEKSAYTLPESGVTAYAGEVDDTKLKMKSVGSFIHKGEPVLLKGTTSEYILMPIANETPATETNNNLTGTEEGKTDCASNVYALSYGQNGVGFYMWEGKDIGANKAYLILPNGAKALSFDFGEGTITGINNVNENVNENLYNLKGMKVDKNYKGIVVNKGKKYIVR